MAILGSYDPGRIVASFGPNILSGYADGSFITATRNSDTFTSSVGADGSVVRVRSRDKSGQIKIVLQAESPLNDILSALAQADEILGTGVLPFGIKDILGTTLITASQAWIMKIPEIDYSKDAGTREWIFECSELEVFVGSSVTL